MIYRLRHAWGVLRLGPKKYRHSLSTLPQDDTRGFQRDRLAERGVW